MAENCGGRDRQVVKVFFKNELAAALLAALGPRAFSAAAQSNLRGKGPRFSQNFVFV